MRLRDVLTGLALATGIAALVLVLVWRADVYIQVPPRPGVPTCHYWTTDDGLSAVVYTQGDNCTHKPVTVGGTRYPTFADYLDGIAEYVRGPSPTRFPVHGLRLVWVGVADTWTNYQPVRIYAGSGDRWDGAAEALRLLLSTGTVPSSPGGRP